mmetsp:Transcript_13756/g.34898  ORF Transcript_13756/g.34898 Transcript_13756/m.34898 type:complete len:200 (-) Transcript_13756:107-706(-)
MASGSGTVTARRPLSKSINSILQSCTVSPIRSLRPIVALTLKRASRTAPMSTKTPDVLTLVTLPSKTSPSTKSSKAVPPSWLQSRRRLRLPPWASPSPPSSSPPPPSWPPRGWRLGGSSGNASSSTCITTRPASGSQVMTFIPLISMPRRKRRPILIGIRSKPSFTAPKSTKTPYCPTLVTVPSNSAPTSTSVRGIPSG